MFNLAHPVFFLTGAGFELNGGMRDVEFFPEHVLHRIQNSPGLVDFLIVDQQMGAQSVDIGANAPDVEFVHAFDFRDGIQFFFHLRDGNVLGHAFQKDVHRIAKDRFGAPEEQSGDGRPQNRVQDVPSRPQHHDAAQNDADGSEGVSENMIQGAFDVEILRVFGRLS